jgi:glutamate synthase (NADPH/NADH) small chain
MENRVKMRTLDEHKRVHHFLEVACGYNEEEALFEAARCLQCKNPKCVSACPVEIDIPGFIQAINHHDLDKAYEVITKDNILPSICGRVCPQESQCEGACIVGIKNESVSIGALERFVGDYAREHFKTKSVKSISKDHKVALVGSGPASLACAAVLIEHGVRVDIFEALHDYGGVLMYGIPSFRLPKEIVKEEIKVLKDKGVHFHKNVIIGKTMTIDELKQEGYDSIFLGTGAGLPSSLGIEGEHASGIYYANEFLTRVNLMHAGEFPKFKTPVKVGNKVAVIGGGNVAMDAARTARRLGAEDVFILYRRDMDSLPARKEEIEHAIEEGIDFRLLESPVMFENADYRVTAVKTEVMKLGELDASNRRRPIGTGTFRTHEVDSVIVAIGQSPNPIVKRATPELETDKWGRIVVDEYGETSINDVYAGGDIVLGAATVILAMGAGKKAAFNMLKKFEN